MKTILILTVQALCGKNYFTVPMRNKTAYLDYFNFGAIGDPVAAAGWKNLLFQISRNGTVFADGVATGRGPYYVSFTTESAHLFYPKPTADHKDTAHFCPDKLKEGDALEILSSDDLLQDSLVLQVWEEFMKIPSNFENDEIIALVGNFRVGR